MANTAQDDGAKNESGKRYTKKELKAYVADLEEKVVGSTGAHLHSLIAINEILRSPGIESLLDEGLKGQLRDLWIKLRSANCRCRTPSISG